MYKYYEHLQPMRTYNICIYVAYYASYTHGSSLAQLSYRRALFLARCMKRQSLSTALVFTLHTLCLDQSRLAQCFVSALVHSPTTDRDLPYISLTAHNYTSPLSQLSMLLVRRSPKSRTCCLGLFHSHNLDLVTTSTSLLQRRSEQSSRVLQVSDCCYSAYLGFQIQFLLSSIFIMDFIIYNHMR